VFALHVYVRSMVIELHGKCIKKNTAVIRQAPMGGSVTAYGLFIYGGAKTGAHVERLKNPGYV